MIHIFNNITVDDITYSKCFLQNVILSHRMSMLPQHTLISLVDTGSWPLSGHLCGLSVTHSHLAD